MITTISETKTNIAFSSSRVTDLREIAEVISTNALKQARSKLRPCEQGLAVEELLGRHDFFECFKYSLVKGVATVLAANDEHILEIYLLDSPANPDIETGEYLPLEATVRLLVIVEKPSAALDAFIASLDRGLTQYLKELPSPLFSGRRSILSIILLSQEEIERGMGYAGLLSAIFVPPLKVW